ncbi:MAG: hypothetical protein WC356_01685 [Candidatus Micrarchaeia archaeon]|jgi:hypothetical protein
MDIILAWLLKTAVGRIIGTALGATLLSGILFAGCQVKGCITHKAEVRAKIAEKILEVEREDQKVKEQVHQMDDGALADFLRRGGVRKDR